MKLFRLPANDNPEFECPPDPIVTVKESEIQLVGSPKLYSLDIDCSAALRWIEARLYR